MKEDKAYIVRKMLTVVSLILIFATAGLLAITTQLKTITFNYYGNIKSIKTLASSVNAFLLQNKVYLSEDAIIEPSKDSRLLNGMTIAVSSETEESFDIESIRESYSPVIASVKEEIEAIPFEEERVDNEDIDSGTTQVIQEGVEGSKSTSYIVKSTNDKVIQKDEIRSEVLAEAQNRVVEVGTKVSRGNTVSSILSTPVDGGFRQYNIALPVECQQYAYNLCARYGVDYEMFLALMYVESRFNASAGTTYIGLCQVWIAHLPNLSSALGISDLYDPYDNMTAGIYLLSNRLSAYSDPVTALNAYNGSIYNNSYGANIMSVRERLIANGGL